MAALLTTMLPPGSVQRGQYQNDKDGGDIDARCRRSVDILCSPVPKLIQASIRESPRPVQYSNEGTSCVLVVMAEDATQSLAPPNHTRGGSWNALDRTIVEPLEAALEMKVLHVALDLLP